VTTTFNRPSGTEIQGGVWRPSIEMLGYSHSVPPGHRRTTPRRMFGTACGRTRSIVIAWIVPAVFVLAAGPGAAAQDARQALFERVFGDAVRLDSAMVAKVKAAKPGERVTVDRNGDGTADEMWFIDTDPRHTAKNRPLLVRVIDEDGDLERYKGPDLDSDLYVADYHADGSVDAVVDYQDNDGDNDVDEMAMYYWSPRHPAFGENALLVWWARDDGDDNLLWYDIDYTYTQDLCQYRSHFGGDETFVAFGLRADSDRWISAWENPFLFYDTDGDQCSEAVLRIEGNDDKVRAIRYSFDADGDAFGRHCHDYDFSITAVAEKDKPVQLPENMVAGMKLRGIPTQRWLRRDVAQQFVTQAQWAKVMLTWDEINANTEADVHRDPHERWEGVIAHGSEHFPQVGGPPCSALNKRYEVSLKPTAPIQLYYDDTDHRLHLKVPVRVGYTSITTSTAGWMQSTPGLTRVGTATSTASSLTSMRRTDRLRLEGGEPVET